MPTRFHAPVTVLISILSTLLQSHHASANGHFSPTLHARADNSTEIQSTAKNKSTSTFLTALWTNAAIFGAMLIAFSILRMYFIAIYEPRTYVPKDESKRSPSLGNTPWGWPFKIWKMDFRTILHQNGVDAYMFVRFQRMMVLIFTPICFVSWAVLLPIDGGNGGAGNTGLNQFTFGNIGTQNQDRYWAHFSCAWVFTLWILGVIYYEMKHFIETRQQYLTDAEHSATAQASTILITGISDEYLNVQNLTTLFSHLPGGVCKVWLNRDLKELPKIYDRRMKACKLLEKAETKVVEMAIKIDLKKHGKGVKDGKGGRKKDDDHHSISDRERGLSFSERLVPRNDWPKHRLPFGPFPFGIPLLSEKVDTIEWARTEIEKTTRLLARGRRIIDREKGRDMDLANDFSSGDESDYDDGKKRRRRKSREETYPAINSAFILFNQQIAAHLAVQALVHHNAFKMTRKYIEVAPADVIWGNLNLTAKSLRMRTAVSYSITAALIVLWSVPVALIGAVSNVSSLCTTYSWLAWICDAPHFVIGLIQGVLPAALLAALMAVLPIVLRLLARFEGVPRRTGMELSLMTRYFIFLVIHSFLIVTLSSGLIAALPGLLQNPTSIPALLAHELPQASNFFLTYIILHGLSGTGSGFLQISNFVMYYLKLSVVGSTPRSLYNVKYRLKTIKFGTEFPEMTLLAVIGIAYMIISPIINGLASVTFLLFFWMYKYRFLYQLGQPASTDTGGLFFPRAIQQILVGVYIQQICLCTLFFLARNEKNEPSAVVQALLMLVLIVVTMICHSVLNRSYNPLIRALPLTRADNSYQRIEGHSKERRPGLGARRRTGKYDPTVDKTPTDFYHPAAKEPIRPIWIPKDELHLGIAKAEVRANKRAGISSGYDNAFMDKKGHVKVDGHPPGGPWRDGEYDDR